MTKQEIIDKLETLERAMSMLTHPCLTREVDSLNVIIRMQGEKLEAMRLEDLKRQTTSTTPLHVIANNIEFGHSHD